MQLPKLSALTIRDMHGGDDAVPADYAPPDRALACQVRASFNHMHVDVEGSQDEIPTAIPPAMAEQQPTYHPRDALHNTGITMLQTTTVGAVIAGVQNTLRKQNVGAMGIITRSGGVIALFAGAGGAYQFTLDATANLQQKDDCYNEFYAGFAAGAFTGIMKRSLPFMLGAGAVFGTSMAAFRYTAGLRGTASGELDDEEIERREAHKKLRRRPLSETLEQLGEGRGIYGPGYEERRRQRIKEKYGIDVKAAQA